MKISCGLSFLTLPLFLCVLAGGAGAVMALEGATPLDTQMARDERVRLSKTPSPKELADSQEKKYLRPSYGNGFVTIFSADKKIKKQTFNVEIANTADQYCYGLMFKREMVRDAGMIFTFSPPEKKSFWMKYTYIPLDMLFIDEAMHISKIARKTVPFSLATIDSEKPVSAVFEINGGEAEKLKLEIGDVVELTPLKQSFKK